jgi:hypothetical protein
MDECVKFKGTPRNKLGWLYVWDFRSWQCRDHYVYCEECRKTSDKKEA